MAGKVVIDWDECIGCGNCVEICPEVFQMVNDADKAEVLKPEGGPEEQIEEAIENCPVECIHRKE